MTKASRESLDAYYAEAGTWADDQRETLRQSRRVAWIVAICAGVIALFLALAIIVMMPLKTVVPYTLMVDKTTGYVQELKPIDAQKIAPDTALTQSFLVQYVIAREGYDRATVQANYKKVLLWSSGPAQADYKNGIQASNPSSPLNFPPTTSLDTRIASVTSMGGNTALVRFETIRRDGGGQPQQPQAWVATISYSFSSGPMSTEDRYINPLGFRVSRYNRDPESAPAQPATGTAPPPVTAPQVIAPGAVPGTPGVTTTPSPAAPPQRQNNQPEVVL